jgi:regulatory protein
MAQRITALEPQKRSKDRVNVYLDGTFAFGLAMIEATRLHVGDVLTDEDVAALKAADEIERARDKALNYLSYRPRSEAEVRRYLSKREFSEVVVEEVIAYLTEIDLVDDEAFARFWVENRTRCRPRGRRGLVYELRQKGVSSVAIESALVDYDEEAAAWRVAEEQARRLTHVSPDQFKRRLRGRLARRGFPYSLIREILATYTSPDYNFGESEVG